MTKEDLEPLVRRASEGDQDAMSALLAALKPVVTRYCRARLGGRDLGWFSADDISQEVCVAVLNALPQYHDRGGAFLYLVHAIAANKVADAIRAGARIRKESGEPEGSEVDLGERLNRLIHTLPRLDQEIVILRVAVGLSAAETAEAVGLKPGNVRAVQQNALLKLRELITREGGF
ncbi:sigma-70 family RNA polymerase sigma factor [Amycolatopsis sp. 195334CR]|uniref:sigma-70 family RNA polymerase sigma factor n=1 Tax=Amycolatopsis sp. 195334CR TaxID=2814588 RepID=UPI001F5DFD82|nr:sigma-70 family RNA polymerase sigma factor [Amycolatopsis sp. 195334CR]